MNNFSLDLTKITRQKIFEIIFILCSASGAFPVCVYLCISGVLRGQKGGGFPVTAVAEDCEPPCRADGRSSGRAACDFDHWTIISPPNTAGFKMVQKERAFKATGSRNCWLDFDRLDTNGQMWSDLGGGKGQNLLPFSNSGLIYAYIGKSFSWHCQGYWPRLSTGHIVPALSCCLFVIMWSLT